MDCLTPFLALCVGYLRFSLVDDVRDRGVVGLVVELAAALVGAVLAGVGPEFKLNEFLKDGL